MSRGTWGQQIASSKRRGRFINATLRWGLATAGGTSDCSNASSLGLPSSNDKPLLHSLAFRMRRPFFDRAHTGRWADRNPPMARCKSVYHLYSIWLTGYIDKPKIRPARIKG